MTAAGGAFLNVKANKLIREMPEVETLYVYPASDDGGTPVGAAILGYLQLCRQRGDRSRRSTCQRACTWGWSLRNEEWKPPRQESGLPYRRMAEPPDEVGGLLADGQDRGPVRRRGRNSARGRSGNRSIMADPRDLRVHPQAELRDQAAGLLDAVRRVACWRRTPPGTSETRRSGRST